MKRMIGPYLCRIETPYLLRRELNRAREQQQAAEQELAHLKQELTRLKQEKKAATAKMGRPEHFSAPGEGSKKPAGDPLAQAKTHFYKKIRAHYAGEPLPAAPSGSLSERDMYRTLQHQADLGDVEAQYILGECSLHGWCTMQFNANAVQWLRRAAQQGHNEAGYRLGLCLIDGKGVSKDEKEGRQWIEKAAASGLVEAKRWLQQNPAPSKMKLFNGAKPDGW